MQTFVRTSGDSYATEKKKPQLGNLGTHIKTKHADKADEALADDEAKPVDHGYSAKSAKIMADMLAEGALHPHLEPTQNGFIKMVAAWIIEENLPWSSGESPGLAALFKYVEVRFKLPTDTTVRNTLAKLFKELHDLVVRELSVCVSRFFVYDLYLIIS